MASNSILLNGDSVCQSLRTSGSRYNRSLGVSFGLSMAGATACALVAENSVRNLDARAWEYRAIEKSVLACFAHTSGLISSDLSMAEARVTRIVSCSCASAGNANKKTAKLMSNRDMQTRDNCQLVLTLPGKEKKRV